MNAIPVIAVLDVGKTNKKVFLFDEDYKIVYERSTEFSEIVDEDGDACEDVDALMAWLSSSLKELNQLQEFDIRAFNFSSYGASFVHLDESGKPFLPLYSYLKPYPADLKNKFFDTYGGEKLVPKLTASPILDSLNSGLQLYRLKYEKGLTEKGGYSLHLPQFLSYLVTGNYYSDITSIGCHTMLWNFETNSYHEWVAKENIDKRLAPVYASDKVVKKTIGGKERIVGVGLHDSSSALIPYLSGFHQPFVLISTGTWCISLNPFNDVPLTDQELELDCLSYLTYQRRPVKASRLFAGHEHQEQAKKLAAHFNKAVNYFETVEYNHEIAGALNVADDAVEFRPGPSAFVMRDLSLFKNYEEAYHQLMADIVSQQVKSTGLVMKGTSVSRIFVDGGFGKNSVYMNMLAAAFPEIEVFAASVSQATAMGAALSIHKHWNSRHLPTDMIDLKFYTRN
jgi:sugar (pentulose or hexulose) kinase